MGKTYLVTGGSGFVGFTVLKLLTTSCSADVDHVKVIDLGFPPALIEEIESKARGLTLEWVEGDITNAEDVLMAAKGCDTVLHIAGIIPGSPPKDDAVMWNVNVTGTKNVVDACCQTEVTALVHISSIAAVGPNMNPDPAEMLEEDGSYEAHPMSWYGLTKKKGEEFVLAANGRKNIAGKVLTTCALRPPTVYGEDFRNMRNLYIMSKWNKTLMSLLPADVRFSHIYVGNLAWAILEAARTMREKKELIGGQAYFAKDDTPEQPYDMLEEFFSLVGFKVSKRRPVAPFWLIYLIFTILEVTIDTLRYLGLTEQTIPQRHILWQMNTRFTVSNRKLVEHFQFKPRFSVEDSVTNTSRFIKRMADINFDARAYDYDLETI